MNNKLPNKLVKLRKYYNYSQQDISEKMGVSITEYMKWENGSSLCTMSQLLRLSRIFKVTIDDLFNNNIVIKLPENNLGDSVEIPFINSNTKSEETLGLDIPIINEKENILEKTIVTRVINENQMEEVETIQNIKPIKKIKKDEVKKEIKPKKINKNNILIALIIVAIISLSIMFFLKNKKNNTTNTINISEVNRLAASSQATFYLQSKGSIISKGNKIDTSKFSDVVQISSSSNYLLGLNQDGTIICSGQGCNIKDFTNVKYISAGKNHALAITNNNEVLCSGNSCDIQNFKDVDFVFAGNDESFAISKGNVLYSGNSTKKDEINSLKGIKSLHASSNYLALLTNSKQVKVISLNDSKEINTTSFNNIISVVAGDDFIAGLQSNGKIIVEGNQEIKDSLSNLENIKFIDANSDYIIAVDKNNIVFGAGNNKYNQFEPIKIQNTQDEEKEEKLEKVTNIKFTENPKSLLITWDNVKNADNYQVSINVSGNYTVKSTNNSLTIDASKFLPNTEYTISIVANSTNEKYTSSDPFIASYKFIGVVENKKYTVTFYDYDGTTVLNQQQVDEGANATPPQEPKRDGYKFVKWNMDYTNITKDTKITAQYEKLKAKTYTITFNDYNDAQISQKTYEENSKIDVPTLGNKDTGENEKVFSNWTPALEETAKKDIVYRAEYVCKIKTSDQKVIRPDSTFTCKCIEEETYKNGSCVLNPSPENTPTP